jgi:iron-sulfur cluster assembly protein
MSTIFIPFQISESAAIEIRKIMATKNIPEGYALRVGIKGGGGCGGFTYVLGFDKKKDGDESFEIQGIPVVMEKKHTMYLVDLTVDFYDEADARGFTFVK